MTKLPLHNFFVFDNEVLSFKQGQPVEVNNGIYEVLRIIDSVPLFLEDHLARFFHSAELAGVSIPFDNKQIGSLLNKMIRCNETEVGNIMLMYETHLQAYFIPHSYPNAEMYRQGVKCNLLHTERHNPNAKVLHPEIRKMADQMIKERGLFEVLFVDHMGHVTEGSRSNVFFVEVEKLVTAPANTVLQGITRRKTIDLAKELHIEIEEREIMSSGLNGFEAAFITGTSPKILPVNRIDDYRFDPQNKITLQLSNAYNSMIERYISSFGNK